MWISLVVPLAILFAALLLQRFEAALLDPLDEPRPDTPARAEAQLPEPVPEPAPARRGRRTRRMPARASA